MATSSITNDISPKNKRSIKKLIVALEKALRINNEDIELKYECSVVPRDKIRAMFDTENEDDGE